MADFCKWAVACEEGLGLEQGSFRRSYGRSLRRATRAALESTPITRHLMALALLPDGWDGTVAELLGELNGRATDDERKQYAWPRTPKRLAGDLRRLAPNLRREGVEVKFTAHTRQGNLVVIKQLERKVETRSQRSHVHKP
jgi:hypothetical protein